jgi:hypothetical protein
MFDFINNNSDNGKNEINNKENNNIKNNKET